MRTLLWPFLILAVFTLSSCLEEQPLLPEGKIEDSSELPPLPVTHPPTDTSGGGVNPQSQSEDPKLLGSRMYVRSVFEEIFSTPATNPQLQVILDKYLTAADDLGISGSASFEYMSLFGGPCDVYDEAGAGKGCNNSRSNLFNPVFAPSTPGRESVRMKTCTEITQNNTLVDAALAKAGLSSSSEYNDANFKKVFALFYPGIDPLNNVLTSFKDLNTVMNNASETSLNRWRMILFTICRSPDWQVL